MDSSKTLFIREFFQTFTTTGAILPSGRHLARGLAAPIRDIQGPRRILEAGPGTGAVTNALIRELQPEDELTLCEINPSFADHLTNRLNQDMFWSSRRHQIRLVQKDVRELFEEGRFDFIVSGLPLNNFPSPLVSELVKGFIESLSPEGSHTFFEYIWIREIRQYLGKQSDRERMKNISQIVDQHLSEHHWSRRPIFANVPPAWVYTVRV